MRCHALRARAAGRPRLHLLWPALDLTRPVSFILGAEREGLPDDVAAACEAVASIPLAEGAESLNVAVAGAIALYELARR